MKIESVADAIIEEAEKEADGIRRAAELEVREMLKKERERLESARKEGLALYEKEAAKVMEERVAAARLEAKKELQMAKDAIAMRVIESVMERLQEIRGRKSEYKKVLESLYGRARKGLGDVPLEIECAKSDVSVVKEIASKNDKVKPSAKIDGGIVARDAAKGVLIDLTFATLLRDKEADIKAYAYKKLLK
ncbi:MAG: V-type ATP synthase subunit E family protein [Candidatus Micrarchaeota archaeon]|nr:V-type ATP synthase subunit E family protein [Candidatus Micrarchaeota archaeon]